MYTVYFKIEFRYLDFYHPAFVQKTIRQGEIYSIYNDAYLWDTLNDNIQSEMDEYFGDDVKLAEGCDLDWYLISSQEFQDTSNLYIKITR